MLSHVVAALMRRLRAKARRRLPGYARGLIYIQFGAFSASLVAASAVIRKGSALRSGWAREGRQPRLAVGATLTGPRSDCWRRPTAAEMARW